MLMRVRERNNEVEIQFSGLGGRQQAVLAALSGTADHGEPMIDRAKLESVSVRARADAMHVRLRAKSGECLDLPELYRGLRRALFEAGRRAAAPLAG
ncbi:MAG TPA: hypothetical protein PLE54_08590 [Burkholderiaceae bacterium]|nr:hypothetical protein [Burkholderiaceae bacterium]HQR70647.1 hypothetical protein [Burkholderiaceae bacterium]